MKTSIALTIIITIAVFSYVSGYSISAHHKREVSYRMAGQANADSNKAATTTTKDSSAASGGYGSSATSGGYGSSATSGGYGSPSSEKAGGTPGYGTPSPGYGQ